LIVVARNETESKELAGKRKKEILF